MSSHYARCGGHRAHHNCDVGFDEAVVFVQYINPYTKSDCLHLHASVDTGLSPCIILEISETNAVYQRNHTSNNTPNIFASGPSARNEKIRERTKTYINAVKKTPTTCRRFRVVICNDKMIGIGKRKIYTSRTTDSAPWTMPYVML
jgi:hypothetical protein